MENPWKEIPLTDYESHMSQASVGQLQALEALMAWQVQSTPARSAVIFGVAGGNGVRQGAALEQIYGVDINPQYLEECKERLKDLGERFTAVEADAADPDSPLPQGELVIANLFVEYVGCDAFAGAVERTGARWVSVGIQIDQGAGFVSETPWSRSFDGLSAIHRQVEERELTAALEALSFRLTGRREIPLPNGKALLGLNYQRR